MKKVSILGLGVLMSMFQHTGHAEAWWMAKAEWHFPALDASKVYQGRGSSGEQALRDARNRCMRHQAGPWSGYCAAAPIRVDYTEVEACGTPWSGWMNMRRGVGNPCPTDCFRGARLARQVRSGGYPPRSQHRELVQCWRKR